MNFFDFSVLVPLVTLISTGGGYLWMVWKVNVATSLIEDLRANDMHTLAERLDRIENKLDQHLAFHVSKQS